MISNLFPYVGGPIIEKMITKMPASILEMFDLSGLRLIGVKRGLNFHFPGDRVKFDGFSKIQIGLIFEDNTVFPIEIKLGTTGLSRALINRKLSVCSLSSHKNENRIKGKVFAVLNRNFDQELSKLVDIKKLYTRIENKNFMIREEWGVVARESVIESWTNYPPEFNNKQRIISIESLVQKFGHDSFNDEVGSLLSGHDYYNLWIKKDV